MIRLAYLGPEGTYSEEAALAHARLATRTREGRSRAGQATERPTDSARLGPLTSIPAAVRAVEEGAADEAVVPVENSRVPTGAAWGATSS